MVKNILSVFIMFFAGILFLNNLVYPQVIEERGVFFLNHTLNPDSQTNATNNERLFSLSSSNENTDNIPFIKSDFIVNTSGGDYGSDQTNVSAAMDGNGNYAFTWIDNREGVKQIYAQFYNHNDEKIGNNFRVNENPLRGNNSPFISANKNGDFVIVWLNDFSRVMAQRFTKDGLKVGENIIVNIIGAFNTQEPSVAVNNDGSFMVMWASEQGNWDYKVYARLFDGFGNPVATEIFVSDPSFSSSSIGQGRKIAIDNKGNYCLTWSSSGLSFSSIYLQIINSAGEKIGQNTLVSSLSDRSRKYFPEIASTQDGHFLITWQTDGIGARIFNSAGYFITNDFRLFDSYGSWHPCKVSSDRDSTFLIFWLRNGYQYLQKIKVNGVFDGDTVRVRYNSGKILYSYKGGLTDIFSGHFFIAPEINERNDANIYFQKFNMNLEPVAQVDKIHDDTESAWQRKPIVRFNKYGESIFLWEDERNGRYDLYARIYDKDFNPVAGDIQINETDNDYWFLYDKKVQSLDDGTFVIAYSGSELYSGGTSIFLQLINTSGQKIGKSKLVKEKYYNHNYKVELNINSDDQILICWFNSYGAYVRKYNNKIEVISSENNFIKYTSPVILTPLDISIDTAFNIFAVWREYNNLTYLYDNKIKGKLFNGEGIAVSGDFIIDSVSSYISNLECKIDSINYAVLYTDNYRVYIKRKYFLNNEYVFDNSFFAYGYYGPNTNITAFNNQKIFITFIDGLNVYGFYANDNKRRTELFKLHTYEYLNNFYYEYNGINSTDIWGENLIFTFESSKNGKTGHDIWANVRNIKNINFNSETFFAPVNYDILYSNYPNPFNLKTKIVYEILSYHKVKLSIYDILGREIKVLVDENQEKGLYEVEFDANDLVSGIYFYRLEAFNTTVKKMLLIK
jgi:hypothetical protein